MYKHKEKKTRTSLFSSYIKFPNNNDNKLN